MIDGINYQQKYYNTLLEAYLRKAMANGLIYSDDENIQQILKGESV